MQILTTIQFPIKKPLTIISFSIPILMWWLVMILILCSKTILIQHPVDLPIRTCLAIAMIQELFTLSIITSFMTRLVTMPIGILSFWTQKMALVLNEPTQTFLPTPLQTGILVLKRIALQVQEFKTLNIWLRFIMETLTLQTISFLRIMMGFKIFFKLTIK